MKTETARSPLEIALLILLGLVTVASTSMGLIAALPSEDAARFAFEGLPLCLGPAFGSAGSFLMIWLRNRARKLSGVILVATAQWFAGATLIGMGLFTALTPGDYGVLQSIGYSFALCMGPGGLLAVLGGITYWAARNRGPASRAESLVGDVVTANPSMPADVQAIRSRAIQYRERILSLIRTKRKGAIGDRLAQIPEELDRWEARVGELADRVAAFEADQVIQADLKRVPEAIARLHAQSADENDAIVRAQMAETLAGYRAQQEELEKLVTVIRRTRLQLEDTLAAMGTVYSQVQLLDAMDIDGVRAGHIVAEIDEQVNGLSDLLDAMSEVTVDASRVTGFEDGQSGMGWLSGDKGAPGRGS